MLRSPARSLEEDTPSPSGVTSRLHGTEAAQGPREGLRRLELDGRGLQAARDPLVVSGGIAPLGTSGDQVIQEFSSPLERGIVRAAQAGRSGPKGVITRPLQNKAVAPHPSVPPELQEQGG